MPLRRGPARHLLYAIVLGTIGLGFLIAGGLLLAVALTPTPDIASFGDRQVEQSTKIYDRTGQVLLYDYNRDARREVVSLADMSPYAVSAVVAMEDASFYSHGGVRITSIIRAVLADVVSGSRSQGGSTITQQVVKNTLLTSRKSVVRKMHEWVLATKLEQTYSKDQILEIYMNDIPYGSTLYGVQAAAEAYYGVGAKDLTLAQSAYLAAMIPAPSYYSPSGAHRAELDARKDLVLDRMSELGFISDDERVGAKSESVSFSPANQSAIIAPHFVFYVLDYLERTYGASALIAGLRVTTTLDAELQAKAEETLYTYGPTNQERFGASNAALIAIDPATGHILSMVGSRDFFNAEIDGQFNATLGLRQPGSTMKPFVYALALLRGYTRNTVIFDVPTQFSTACAPSDIDNNEPPCYAPRNYDGRFRGPMTFETALAQSINIPAVKVLYLSGISGAVSLAKSFGLTTLGDSGQYGLTLVLGGGEVRLLDLVGGYAAFGNDGVLNPPVGILEVSNGSGEVLERYESRPARAIASSAARTISAMLSNAYARLPEYPLNSPLSFPGYEVAVKTGTTDDTRDAWVVGYTPSIALGVWTGNNDHTPMVKSVAGLIAAPMWHEVMAYAVARYPKAYFGAPDAADADTPPILSGSWKIPDVSGNTAPHSLLYWTDKNSPITPPSDPEKDPQFDYWEYGLSFWFANHPELFSNGTLTTY